MKASSLSDGRKMYIIKIDMYVTRGRFILALIDHIYRNDNDEILENLKKSEARKILSNELFHHGIQGEYPDGMFEGSFEISERRNDLHQICSEWIDKNYPYLK